MILQAFSLRDMKAEIFAAPFFVPNEHIAIRLVSELVRDPRSDLGKYPQDFMLYRTGSFNTETALLTATTIELVCSATNCLPKADPRQIQIPGTEQKIEVLA